MIIVLWIVQFHSLMILQKDHCINPAGANNSSSGNSGPMLTIFPLSPRLSLSAGVPALHHTFGPALQAGHS